MTSRISFSSRVRYLGLLALGTAACGDDGGSADEAGTGTGESPEECGIVNCAEEVKEANQAPPLEACNGGSVNHSAAESIDGVQFPQPGPVTTTTPETVGHWSSVVTDDLHLAIHSIHRPTGKFLQYGKDHTSKYYDSDKFVWFPPEPCSPYDVGVTNCNLQFEYGASPLDSDHLEAPNPAVDLFCSGHVNVPPRDIDERIEPHTVTIGGQPSFGENSGINASWLFSESMTDEDVPLDDFSSVWDEIPNAGERRWYPTMTVLSDGKFLASGGTTVQSTECKFIGEGPNDDYSTGIDCACELDEEDMCPAGCYFANALASPNENPPIPAPCICNYGASPADKAGAGFSECNQLLFPTVTVEVMERDGEGDYSWSQIETGVPKSFSLLYPFAFVLPDLPDFITDETFLGGKVFTAGAEAAEPSQLQGSVFDPADASPEYTEVGCKTCTVGSSAVMYEPGKIMKFGGGYRPSRMTEVIDFSDPLPKWRRVGSTSVGRHYSSGVILPDGTVLATGGSMEGDSGNSGIAGARPELAVTTTDLFDPATETWCRLADIPSLNNNTPATYRGYHSQSFLLPDGRVYLGAGGYSAVDHFDHQFFFPPYLFQGPRPEFSTGTSDPDTLEITTGETFTLTPLNEVEIEQITLIKLASSTHNWDMEQRFLRLEFTVESEPTTGEPEPTTWLSVTAPTSTCYATPGPYMMFALSPLGVPSIGQYVYVKGTCAAAETPIAPPAAASNFDFTNRPDNDGMAIACGTSLSAVSLTTSRLGVLELCSAFDSCPEDETVTVSARLVASDTATVPPGGVLLDTAEVEFSDWTPTINDDLTLMTSGTTWTASGTDLGPGRNVVEFCGTIDSTTVCREQVIHVGTSAFGPDSAGNRVVPIESGYTPLARILGARRLDLVNDQVLRVDLPPGFTFPFYGTAHRSLRVGANGGIRLTSGAVAASNAGALPETGVGTGPHIAVFWDDLDVEASGGVYTHFRGDRFIVSWEGVSHTSAYAPHTVSFQAHLFGDGRIEFHYEDTDLNDPSYDEGASTTIGIQHPAQTTGILVSANSSTLLSTHRSFAIAQGCIASALRASDGACDAKLSGPAVATAAACGGGPIDVEIPKLSKLCPLSPEAFVQGAYETQSEPRRFQAERVAFPPGEREVTWTIQAPVSLPEGPTYQSISQEFVQSLEVQESRAPGICCGPDQTSYTLTSGSNTASYGLSAPMAVCVDALAGADTITSGSSADTLIGGDGNDVLSAGNGNDRIFGGAHSDQIYGGGNDDLINGDDGDDDIEGGSGNDQIFGSSGDDQILGGDGIDVIYPGSGEDIVDAGGGDDDIVVLHACEVISGKILDGGSGTDRLLLPVGLTLTDLTLAGVTVSGIEAVVTDSVTRGVSDCDPTHGDLAVP